MIDLVVQKMLDPRFLASLLFAVAAAATILTIAMPLLTSDQLSRRMKNVATERDRIRARERARMNASQGGLNTNASLRSTPKAYMQQVVDKLKLADWLGMEDGRMRLAMAGYRGKGAETALLFFRLIIPIAVFLVAMLYMFVLEVINQPVTVRLVIVAVATFVGVKAPELFISNQIQKRQLSLRRSFPDALDLLLICVESGMSIEHAFKRVSGEVATQSIALAEELTLTTAELSYLTERRQAYENFAKRTGVESVKSVTTALIQAERYGTPLGQTLRVLAQESRDQRMTLAEKKAAELPPKLTVPMIIFFLPVLIVVIMTPALIGANGWK